MKRWHNFLGIVLVATVWAMGGVTLVNPNSVTAEETGKLPELCVKVFNLPEGTQRMKKEGITFTDEQCQAYQYLLDTRNGCSNGDGISGAKDPKDCIRALDRNFVVNLKKLFEENPSIFGSVTITSGYRTPSGEKKVGGSTGVHVKGCAVDLSISSQNCGNACEFIQKSGSKYSVSIRYPHRGEYNHVEPTGACNGNPGADPGSSTSNSQNASTASKAPSSALSDFARGFLSGFSGQSAAQQSAMQCSMQGGTWMTLSYTSGQGYCQPAANQTSAVQCVQQGGTWIVYDFTTGQGYCQPKAMQQSQTPTVPQTTTAQTSSSGTANTSSNTTAPDPVLVCTQQASDPVCGKQTTCPSVVSPNEKCTIGARKTYLNTCLMNADNAMLISPGRCQTTASHSSLPQDDDKNSKDDSDTTVTLVADPSATVGELKDQQVNAFTHAPAPGTPSYDQQRLMPGQSVVQETFTTGGIAGEPGTWTSASMNTSFVYTALTTITTALKKLQQMVTPMRYTVTKHTDSGEIVQQNDYINEDAIPLRAHQLTSSQATDFVAVSYVCSKAN